MCIRDRPFVIEGSIPNYIDALFETVSGFTTTGASILTDIESLPRSLLFWRSFTHWVGGMGVLVFIMAIVPLAGGRSVYLMRAETPGPSVGKLAPKMRSTAMILYGIYISLTAVSYTHLDVYKRQHVSRSFREVGKSDEVCVYHPGRV